MPLEWEGSAAPADDVYEPRNGVPDLDQWRLIPVTAHLSKAARPQPRAATASELSLTPASVSKLAERLRALGLG